MNLTIKARLIGSLAALAAAMVEESTAASHTLSREATALSDLMAQFRLSEGAAEPQRAASSRNPVHAAQARVRQLISRDQTKPRG